MSHTPQLRFPSGMSWGFLRPWVQCSPFYPVLTDVLISQAGRPGPLRTNSPQEDLSVEQRGKSWAVPAATVDAQGTRLGASSAPSMGQQD